MRKYSEYKNSGIPWIGNIPSHWNIQRGKNVLTLLDRPILDTDDVITCFRDGEVTLRKNRREEGFTLSFQEIGYQGVEPGDLVVHPEIDVDSSSFVKEISSIKNATYVLVALGNDDDNISTAINLRMYFERIKAKPIIQAIVYNSQQKRALKGIKNFKGQDYRIDFIGDLESSYIEDAIIDSELEKEALKRHLSYVKAKIDGKEFNREEIKAYLAECGVTEDELFALYDSVKSHPKKHLTENEARLLEKTKPYILKRINEEQAFWNFEYNYRSSVASAIHMKARIDCGIPGAAKKTEELTVEERDIIEELEHKRWNAYMRAEGYIYSLSTDPSSRNDLAKMHHDLVEYSALDGSVKRIDSQVGTK